MDDINCSKNVCDDYQDIIVCSSFHFLYDGFCLGPVYGGVEIYAERIVVEQGDIRAPVMLPS